MVFLHFRPWAERSAGAVACARRTFWCVKGSEGVTHVQTLRGTTRRRPLDRLGAIQAVGHVSGTDRRQPCMLRHENGQLNRVQAGDWRLVPPQSAPPAPRPRIAPARACSLPHRAQARQTQIPHAGWVEGSEELGRKDTQSVCSVPPKFTRYPVCGGLHSCCVLAASVFDGLCMRSEPCGRKGRLGSKLPACQTVPLASDSRAFTRLLSRHARVAR